MGVSWWMSSEEKGARTVTIARRFEVDLFDFSSREGRS